MSAELRFIASTSASAFHAAEAIVRPLPLVEAAVHIALQDAARMIDDLASAAGLPKQLFWQTVVPLAAQIDGNSQLADVLLAKLLGRGPKLEMLAPRFAAAFTQLEAAQLAALPDLLNELELRSGPLREQWEARGPGLMHQIGKLTAPELVVERADVLLCHPVLGGGGDAHLAYNSVSIEAVLANPHQQLPEIVRLAWLVAQLNCDLPAHSENFDRQRLSRIAALALLPPAIQAGETVELCRHDPATMEFALTTWHVGEANPAAVAAVLGDWWQTYAADPPPWHIALSALDMMLSEGI